MKISRSVHSFTTLNGRGYRIFPGGGAENQCFAAKNLWSPSEIICFCKFASEAQKSSAPPENSMRARARFFHKNQLFR